MYVYIYIHAYTGLVSDRLFKMQILANKGDPFGRQATK